jgi:hypothetical protein
MREAFVFEGGGAGIDTDKATRWGVQRLWYQHDDPTANAGALAACRSRGVRVGLKMDGTGPLTADAMDKALTAHGFPRTTGPFSCGAMFDDELHDWGQTVDLLRRWRSLRKTRYTLLTFESFQGPAIPSAVVAFVNADANLLIVVQVYGTIAGDEQYPMMMTAAVDELVAQGFLREKIRVFLPVKTPVEVPYGWEGVLYGFQALPASPPAPL